MRDIERYTKYVRVTYVFNKGYGNYVGTREHALVNGKPSNVYGNLSEKEDYRINKRKKVTVCIKRDLFVFTDKY